MTKPLFKATTAMVAALTLIAPAQLVAQSSLDLLKEADPDARPICSDGTEPTCDSGLPLLSAGELALRALMPGVVVDGEIQAMCMDQTVATCADGSAAILPGEEGYEAALNGGATAAPVEEPVAEAPAEEPAAEEPAAEEPAAEPEVVAEEPAAEEPAPAEEVATEEPAPEEPMASEETQGTVETEGTIASDATTPDQLEADLAANAEAEATTEETAAAEAPVEEKPLVIPGAEQFQEQVQQTLDQIANVGAADEGEGSKPAALIEGDAEAEATTEVEVTEEDTRQSDEDFTTTANANIGADANAGDRGGMSDLEKAALVGLGALAVGAILSNGDEVVTNSGDRVVVQGDDGNYYVLKDDDTLLRQPGARVKTESFSDGSTRTTVTREDGSKIITIRDAAGRVVYRVRENEDGSRVTLIDDTEATERVEVSTLPEAENREVIITNDEDVDAIRLALERASARDVGRTFSLRQVRQIEQVRKLVPEMATDSVNFRTGSAAVDPSEAEELLSLGRVMSAMIEANPGEVFLIEGHTDAVGNAAYNLALSDRRAESVALALTEYFGVRPENMVVQGYGESDLKIETLSDERLNRRVTVRRITPLLEQRVARN